MKLKKQSTNWNLWEKCFKFIFINSYLRDLVRRVKLGQSLFDILNREQEDKVSFFLKFLIIIFK